jgi:hypothetical protein
MSRNELVDGALHSRGRIGTLVDHARSHVIV